MHWYVGVDGGGTKTAAVVTDASGQVLGRGESGPSNYHGVGLETATASVTRAVQAALSAAGLARTRPAAACFGLAGAARPEDVALLLPGLAPLAATVRVTHDAAVALAGATGGAPGVIVIAGTGSIAYGEAADGRSARSGGWGWLLDDAGSGFDVGRRTLQAVIRAADGRGPATDLTVLVQSHWGLASVDGLIGKVYHPLIGREEMAGLAKLAATAASAGDEVARAIWQEAGEALAEQAAAVMRTLSLGAAPVAPVGGLWRAGALLQQPFADRLAALAPGARIGPPAMGPAEGAALLARRMTSA